jgi:hypothetical protein
MKTAPGVDVLGHGEGDHRERAVHEHDGRLRGSGARPIGATAFGTSAAIQRVMRRRVMAGSAKVVDRSSRRCAV